MTALTFQKTFTAQADATQQELIQAIQNRLPNAGFAFQTPVDLRTIEGYFSVTFTGTNEEGSLVSDQMSDTDDFVTYELDELPVESLIQILALLES